MSTRSTEKLDLASSDPNAAEHGETAISSNSGSANTEDGPIKEQAGGPSPEERKSPLMLNGWRLAIVQFCFLSGLLLSMMEASIVATSLVTIARDFDDFIRINWVVLAYLLTYMGFSIIYAKSSDVVGRKWSAIGAFSIFSVFSLGCGFTQDLNQLIALRALQGLGGAGLYSMPMITMPDITPPKFYGMMSAMFGAVFAIASVLGPVLGGVITTYSTWRWIFWINVPCGVVLITVLLLAWPGAGRVSGIKRTRLAQVDYAGAILQLGGAVLLVFALQEGGAAAYAWNSPTIICTLVFSGVCWILFSGWVAFLSTRGKNWTVKPILPARLITRRITLIIITSTLLTGFSFFTVLINLPLRFQLVNRNSAVKAGLHLLPMLIASAAGSTIGGAASSKRNNTYYTLVASGCFMLLGVGLLSTVPDSVGIEPAQYGFQVLMGFGVGLTFSTATIMTIANAEPRDIAVAQGTVAQARIFGGSIGLSIATIVFNKRAVDVLSGVLTPTQLDDLRQSLNSVLTLDPEQQRAVINVFATSFNDQLRICTYVAAAALLVSICAFQRHPPPLGAGRRGPRGPPAASSKSALPESSV